ncbi:MAG TPA: FtsX-like permease family protein, partial [Puia sp.]|nr:FtsX-like permease family protein [Puia sp.]
SPGVLGASWSGGDLANLWSSTGDADWDGKKPTQKSFIINQMSVDRDFIPLLNLQFKEGKGFTGTPADSSNYILNETAIHEMGLKDPVGKRFKFHERDGVIVGVLKDFHFKNLHSKIEPIILFYNPNWRQQIYVKTKAKDASRTIASLTQIWKKYNPDYPFDYKFMDDNFDQMYRSDLRVGKLFNCFAAITIFISCLGLFGLVTYNAESKIKEIGVRKVLGASVPNIVGLMSKDFLKLVIIATAIAFPIAWWALHKMLEDYAYRTEISGWVFVVAGLGVFLVSWITIGFQAVKTALANPIASLRNE